MNVISKHLDQSMHSHIGCIYLAFFHCAFLMCPQMACLRGYIVALIAFIWLFSAVRFQMGPQMACLRGCIVTLVAFVWLFSTVHFQMGPQMACLRGCIVTLVAFVWSFPSVRFHMCPQTAYLWGCKVTLGAFIWLGDILSCFLQNYICILWTKVIIGHLFFHCQCVLCCAQMVASNWVKFIFDYWFPIIKSATFSMANFHFLDRGMSQQPQSRKRGVPL